MAKAEKIMIQLESDWNQYTQGVPKDIVLYLKWNKRTPKADLEVNIPSAFRFQEASVFVNVMGRGEVSLTELHRQSAGRFAIGHEVLVGQGRIRQNADASKTICIQDLDVRPDNGTDVELRICEAIVEAAGKHLITVQGNAETDGERVFFQNHIELEGVTVISDFRRVIKISQVYDVHADYQSAAFVWSGSADATQLHLLHSLDLGVTWEVYQELETDSMQIQLHGLEPDKEHWFCLSVTGGRLEGISNIAKVYSGMYNIRTVGKAPTDGSDAAKQINKAVDYIYGLGGGTVLFEGGHFSTTTVTLRSNVYLYIDKSAQILALRGCQDEEKAWYSDQEYREDMSHMSNGPYLSPDNWMTKQDAGHSYWQNALFFGLRQDNVKIVGNGRIAGEGNLTKSNTVMEHESGNRADKMIALKLCTNVEIGGLSIGRDLWYEETDEPNKDEPFYLKEDGGDSLCGIDNMLHVSNGGHFVLLATGVDGISTHDIYAEKGPQVRDIFDYMSCNDIVACNIYAEGAPDDVIKLGSDCSLGFTRPSRNCIVRNIIGDTACNLFQIGSETADAIQDVCIDNIYVLASNKAGFSISVNDGGDIRNVHLNCGGSVGCCEQGIYHGTLSIGYEPAKIIPHKSKMRRTRTPFFISLSNRGRVLGAEAAEKAFVDDTGVYREELMIANVNIGSVKNIFLKGLNIREVYGASQSKSDAKSRWPIYEGQARTTPLIVGYKIPDGTNMTLPDGTLTKSIENVHLEGIDMLVKGGNPSEDAQNTPRELGVGQFNLRNLAEDERGSKIPAYGFYVRHVDGMTIQNCTVSFEENDERYAVVLEDVKDIRIEKLVTGEARNNKQKIKYI